MRQNDINPSIPDTIPLAPVPMKGHLPCLDGLRGIAIIMVMMCHFAGDYREGSHSLLGLLRFGSAGVDLFFVLSGFLITGLLFDSKSSETYYRDFFLRRILRIIPLYYLVLVATLVVLPMFGLIVEAKMSGREIWLWCFASNVIQGGPVPVSLGCFGHFWSLAVEEHFYLIWPFVIRACDRKRGILVCLGCILFSILTRVLIVSTLDPIFARNAVNYWTPCRIEALAVGGLIALVARGPAGLPILKRTIATAVPVLMTVLGLLLCIKTNFFSLSSVMVILRSSLCAWIGGTSLIVALLSSPANTSGRLLTAPLLRKFGKHSYALYVFHYLLMPVFEKLCPIDQVTAWTGSELVARTAFLLVMMSGSWIMAALSWRLIEHPFLSLKDVWAPRMKALTMHDQPAGAILRQAG